MWILKVKMLGVLMLTLVVQVDAFRSQSRCETIHNSGHVIANCSSRNLDYIPWDLHHDIRTLDLSDNNISLLRKNSFDKYVNIEKLYLQRNQLQTIKAGAFFNLNRLKVLDLSGNNFEFVPTKSLSDVPNLNVLTLKANKLNRLEKNSFQGLPFLRELNLAGNHINIISPFTFSGLDLLHTLELQDNALQSLTIEDVFGLGRKLKTIRLYNNPWFCDCRLQWLKQWLNNGTVSHGLEWNFPGLGPNCAGPTLVQKKPVSHVKLEHFACPIEMYTSGSRVILKPGDSTALYCKYFSITDSSVVWFKENKMITNSLNPDKYKIIESGRNIKQSVLNIYDFESEDEGEYRCLAENIRGTDYIKFVVMFEQPKIIGTKELATAQLSGQNQEKIIIAVSAVAGFVILILIVCLIVRYAIRIKQRKKQKRDQIRLQLKHHDLETTNMDKSTDKIDGEDSSNDETIMKLKMEDRESIHSENSFSNIYAPTANNGNTYISFSSELTEPDPDDISQIYSAIRNPPPPGSHTESTTPLLDYQSPSFYESDEPIYDTRAYSVVSVNVPHRTNYYVAQSFSPRTPGSVRSNNFYPELDQSNDFSDYNDVKDYSRNNFPDFSDYRDVYKLPCTPPTSKNLTNDKKSASVGHLGPMGPRKPPRSFQAHTPRGTSSELGVVNHTPRGTSSEIGGVNHSKRPPRVIGNGGDYMVKTNHMYRPTGVATSEIMGPTYSQPMRQFGMPAGKNFGANYNRKPEMPAYELARSFTNDNRPEILSSNLSRAPISVTSDTLGSNASQRTRSSVSSSELLTPPTPPRTISPSPPRSKKGSTPSTPTSPGRSITSSIASPSSFKDLPPGTPV